MTKGRSADIIISVPGKKLLYGHGYGFYPQADMAELADAPDLGSGVPDVQVQVLLSAVYGVKSNPRGSDFAPLFIGRKIVRNVKFMNQWFRNHNISLAAGFAEKLRGYAKEYKRIHNINLGEIYTLLGCSKQNVSYWEIHCDSTQAGNSILRVVRSARELFGLTDDEMEGLANCAGLSLDRYGGDLLETLKYRGKICELSASASISERMLRHYKKNSYETGAYGHSALPGHESGRTAGDLETIRVLPVGKRCRGYGGAMVSYTPQ